MKKSVYLFLLFILITIGCAQNRYFTPATTIKEDKREINDSLIKEILSTKSQLVEPISIAIYSSGSKLIELVDSIKKIEGVRGIFEISPALIEGEGYFKRMNERWYSHYNTPENVNIDLMRKIAAQGHADIVIFCGTYHHYTKDLNWLGITYFLLIPALFVPGSDLVMNSDMEAYIFDVRNGFLYSTYHNSIIYKENYVSALETSYIDKIKHEQELKLFGGVIETIKELLSRKEYFLK